MRSFVLILAVTVMAGCATEPAPVTSSVRLNFSIKNGQPSADSLYPVFPNPFNRFAGDTGFVFQFALADSGSANLVIQNALGDQIAIFSDTSLPAGYYYGSWDPLAADGSRLMTGIYFVTLHHGNYINSRLIDILENE